MVVDSDDDSGEDELMGDPLNDLVRGGMDDSDSDESGSESEDEMGDDTLVELGMVGAENGDETLVGSFVEESWD